MGLAEVAGMGVDARGVTSDGGGGTAETRLASWNIEHLSDVVIQNEIRCVICTFE